MKDNGRDGELDIQQSPKGANGPIENVGCY